MTQCENTLFLTKTTTSSFVKAEQPINYLDRRPGLFHSLCFITAVNHIGKKICMIQSVNHESFCWWQPSSCCGTG